MWWPGQGCARCGRCVSTWNISFWSSPIPLGTVQADADGVIRTTVTIPAVNAGLHSVVFEGESADGVGRTERLLVDVAGRPVGSYATYLCCFEAESSTVTYNATDELVDVYWNGELLDTLRPDENGGVIVQLPFIDRLINPTPNTLRAVSQLTGRVITRNFDDLPTTAALWASSTRPDAIDLRGGGVAANGLIHSEGGITIAGAGATLTGGTEYTSSLVLNGAGSTFTPAPRRVLARQGSPLSVEISSYRPGGSLAAGPNYLAVAPSACVGGVWSPTPAQQYSGVVYVPCAVSITQANTTVAATIAAEGPVKVSGANITIGRAESGVPSIVTGATGADAVILTGAKLNTIGTVFAPTGDVRISGAQSSFVCGVFAQAILASGGGPSFTMTSRCMRPQ